MPGLTVRKLWRPIDRVGLYVPGGATPLFSTLLMLALPAEAAGVGELVVVTPPRADGSLDPLVDKALAEGWPLKRIEAILRAVLRAGAYELGHRNDVPARVVVSEYVDVANAFVDKDETGMVNAVLDQIARRFRGGEFTVR